MCAPHQATMLADCTPEEACCLLAVAGFNANPEFLDLYLRADPETELTCKLRKVAESKVALRDSLIALPDDSEGGRQALDQLRKFLGGDCSVLSVVTGQGPGGSCCHKR
jgi:hypothetical protein